MKITKAKYYNSNVEVWTDEETRQGVCISLCPDEYGDADDEADATAMAKEILDDKFPGCERNLEWEFLRRRIRDCFTYPGDWRNTKEG